MNKAAIRRRASGRRRARMREVALTTYRVREMGCSHKERRFKELVAKIPYGRDFGVTIDIMVAVFRRDLARNARTK